MSPYPTFKIRSPLPARNPNSIDHVMSVSTDGKSVTDLGNSWNLFKLDTPFEVTPSTVLKFSFNVPHEVEAHILCLLNSNNNKDGRDDCFATPGLEITSSTDGWKKVDPWTTDGGSNANEIWVGSYFMGPVRE